MIHQIFNAKSIILNRKNNLILMYKDIAQGSYTNIFTSLEIAFSKKFKTNFLNHPGFSDRFCLFAIDKIYFIN